MKFLLSKEFLQNRMFFIVLLILDVIVLALHLLFGSSNHFFHLDFENNLPTYYQALKLLGFSIVFLLETFRVKDRHTLYFTLSLSLFLLFLGIDESLQLHENIYRFFEYLDLFPPSKIVEASMNMGYRSSLWILYYLPLIVIFMFWSGYWLRYFQAKMKSNVWIFAVSTLSFFTVILAELLSSTGTYSELVYFWLITIEETGEMLLATSLIYSGTRFLSRAC